MLTSDDVTLNGTPKATNGAAVVADVEVDAVGGWSGTGSGGAGNGRRCGSE